MNSIKSLKVGRSKLKQSPFIRVETVLSGMHRSPGVLLQVLLNNIFIKQSSWVINDKEFAGFLSSEVPLLYP